jgi:flagellin-like protein
MRTTCAMRRKSEEAVAPVIATILMVAITVVLAAVLYALIGTLVDQDKKDLRYITAIVGNNDKNWTVDIIDISGGPISTSDVCILVTKENLSVGLRSTPVSDMESGTYHNGVRFIEATTDGEINVGDMFTLDRSIYARGTGISLVNADESKVFWDETV